MSRRFQHVVAKRHHPDGVGFEYSLNTIPGAPPEIATYLEDSFFKAVDNDAADAMQALLTKTLYKENARLRNGWSRFIMSLIQRTPEKAEWLTRVWAARYAEAVAEAHRIEKAAAEATGKTYTPEPRSRPMELDRGISWARVMQTIIDSANVGTAINGMEWVTIELHEGFELLTSDRPVIMTNGIKGDDGHIAIPISPRKLFVAANTRKKITEINGLGAKRLARSCNEVVVGQAHRYVYSTNDRQTAFVEARLGKQPSQFRAPADLLKEFPRIDWPPK
jgi:hypothetical protein